MRKCLRCQHQMIEDLDIKVENAYYGIVINANESLFAKRLGKPKLAICPNCGEISFYVEDTQNVIDYFDKNR